MSRIRLVDLLFGGAIALLGVGQELSADPAATPDQYTATETRTLPGNESGQGRVAMTLPGAAPWVGQVVEARNLPGDAPKEGRVAEKPEARTGQILPALLFQPPFLK